MKSSWTLGAAAVATSISRQIAAGAQAANLAALRRFESVAVSVGHAAVEAFAVRIVRPRVTGLAAVLVKDERLP